MGHVYRSIVIDAPVDQVWAKLRNFHDLSWATGVVEKLDVVGALKGDQVGAQRKLNDVFEETLVELNDHRRRVRYSIDDAKGTPVASSDIKNYVGSVQAYPITEGGQTFVEWQSSWDDNSSAGAEFCGGIYSALLGALKGSFA